jgi:hypothetical protein
MGVQVQVYPRNVPQEIESLPGKPPRVKPKKSPLHDSSIAPSAATPPPSQFLPPVPKLDQLQGINKIEKPASRPLVTETEKITECQRLKKEMIVEVDNLKAALSTKDFSQTNLTTTVLPICFRMYRLGVSMNDISFEAQMNDNDFDRMALESNKAQRDSKNHTIALNIKEILKRQNVKKEMHTQLNSLTAALCENSSSFDKLKWAKQATTILTIVTSILCLAFSWATGGLSGLLAGISAGATIVDGGMGAVQGISKMEQQKLVGQATETRELINADQAKTQSILESNHQAVQQAITFKNDMHIIKTIRETSRMMA